MSRKNVIQPYRLVTNGSTGATFTSSVINLPWLDNICIESAWTGTAVGTIKVEGSSSGNVYEFLKDVVGNDIQHTVSGVADNGMFDLNQLSFNYLRVVFTRTSGTGTINIWVSGKML